MLTFKIATQFLAHAGGCSVEMIEFEGLAVSSTRSLGLLALRGVEPAEVYVVPAPAGVARAGPAPAPSAPGRPRTRGGSSRSYGVIHSLLRSFPARGGSSPYASSGGGASRSSPHREGEPTPTLSAVPSPRLRGLLGVRGALGQLRGCRPRAREGCSCHRDRMRPHRASSPRLRGCSRTWQRVEKGLESSPYPRG